MTGKDAEHYLKQVYMTEERVNGLIRQISKYKDMATHITASWGDGIKSGSSHSQVEQAVVKIVCLEQDANDEIDNLVSQKRRAKNVVSQVDDPKQRALLDMHYFQYMPFCDIASKMHYSDRQLRRLHTEALKSVAEILCRESQECIGSV